MELKITAFRNSNGIFYRAVILSEKHPHLVRGFMWSTARPALQQRSGTALWGGFSGLAIKKIKNRLFLNVFEGKDFTLAFFYSTL